MTTPDPISEEWEVIYDDGFVYKRKRRHLDPTRLAPSSFPDQGLEQKYKTKRKLNALLKIKTKYHHEIQLWEGLVDKLKHLEQNVQFNSNINNDGKVVDVDRIDSGEYSGSGSGSGSDSKDTRKIESFRIDDILLQVEAQVAIIHNLSNLCDEAEALCDAYEEKKKESLFNLPIWGSPRELMTYLCDDD